jgi:hypothetical protein
MASPKGGYHHSLLGHFRLERLTSSRECIHCWKVVCQLYDALMNMPIMDLMVHYFFLEN